MCYVVFLNLNSNRKKSIMKITAKIFNECIDVKLINGVDCDSDYLNMNLPQIEYRAAGLDKKYKTAELQDLKNQPNYMNILSELKPVKNVFYIAYGSLLLNALCEYYGNIGNVLNNLPNATLVDSIGDVKAKGILITMSGALSKSTVDKDLLHGDGSGIKIAEFINKLNQPVQARQYA